MDCTPWCYGSCLVFPRFPASTTVKTEIIRLRLTQVRETSFACTMQLWLKVTCASTLVMIHVVALMSTTTPTPRLKARETPGLLIVWNEWPTVGIPIILNTWTNVFLNCYSLITEVPHFHLVHVFQFDVLHGVHLQDKVKATSCEELNSIILMVLFSSF